MHRQTGELALGQEFHELPVVGSLELYVVHEQYEFLTMTEAYKGEHL